MPRIGIVVLAVAALLLGGWIFLGERVIGILAAIALVVAAILLLTGK